MIISTFLELEMELCDFKYNILNIPLILYIKILEMSKNISLEDILSARILL